jgi:hypothetical protein
MLDVRFTPESDRTGMSPRMTRRAIPTKCIAVSYCILFDHLVGSCEQRWRNVQSQCLGGL